MSQEELKGLSKVEKVLLDTADSVIDTKKKIEFGVKQVLIKVSKWRENINNIAFFVDHVQDWRIS